MSDLFGDGSQAVSRRPRWYRRRGPQVLGAAVAAGLVIAGVSYGAVGAASDPRQDVAEAMANLQELPSGMTLQAVGDKKADVSVVLTDDGAKVSVQSARATFEVALVDERLYLRVDRDMLQAMGSGAPALQFLSGFGSVGALLDGKWVSIDASADSEVLAALADLRQTTAADPGALRAAGEDLRSAVQTIADGLRDPFRAALAQHASVTQPGAAPSGPEGSDHYRVTFDGDAIITQLEPELRSALQELLTAVDAFVADAQAQMPEAAAKWAADRSQAQQAFDDAMAKDRATKSADVWIADGEFTRIDIAGTTLTFDPNPSLDGVQGAVDLDSDLLRLLPIIKSMTAANPDLLSRF